jgi:hypothetical protein
MRQVVARSSYPARPTSEPVPSLPAGALRSFGSAPASPPPWQPQDEHARALREALIGLEHLVAARDEARAVVVEHDERIRAAVARLHAAGASWGQIGAALGITRQGARQRFDAIARATYRTQDSRAAATTPRQIATPPGAAPTPTKSCTDARE